MTDILVTLVYAAGLAALACLAGPMIFYIEKRTDFYFDSVNAETVSRHFRRLVLLEQELGSWRPVKTAVSADDFHADFFYDEDAQRALVNLGYDSLPLVNQRHQTTATWRMTNIPARLNRNACMLLRPSELRPYRLRAAAESWGRADEEQVQFDDFLMPEDVASADVLGKWLDQWEPQS